LARLVGGDERDYQLSQSEIGGDRRIDSYFSYLGLPVDMIY